MQVSLVPEPADIQTGGGLFLCSCRANRPLPESEGPKC